MRGPLPLYDLTGFGFLAYTGLALDVRLLGAENFLLRPRMLLVSTHRSDRDVPVIGAQLYTTNGNWRRRELLPHFAVRDDLYLRGFFAGYPPWTSALPRALLWPLGAGAGLRRVRCLPIRSAERLRLVEAFRACPDDPVAELAPADALEGLISRGVDPALPARNALRPQVADVLWRSYGRDELAAPALEPVWEERRRDALADFRRLVGAIDRGGTLLIFPEGRPSPGGEIGPLEGGVAALVRRARPDWLLPIAPAYDPLGPGRTRAHVSVGAPAPPPRSNVDDELLELLRTTTPLTVGQLVARAVLEGRDLDAAQEVAAAEAEGRPVERDLLDPGLRERRIMEALAAPRDEATLRFLAREHASARGDPAGDTVGAGSERAS